MPHGVSVPPPAVVGRPAGCVEQRVASFFPPWRMLILFTLCNLLNYMDRGVIPGAFTNIGQFARESTGSNKEDSLLGSLQSAFIVGYAVASVVMGHLIHRFPPFRLMAVGLLIWCVAVVICAISPAYWVLVLARVLSGVGEASFQCVVPPFLDDNAPRAQRSLWLSIFFMAIPTGTALGVGYGGVMGASGKDGWRWAFALEAIPMLPIALITYFLPYHQRARDVDLVISDATSSIKQTSNLNLQQPPTTTTTNTTTTPSSSSSTSLAADTDVIPRTPDFRYDRDRRGGEAVELEEEQEIGGGMDLEKKKEEEIGAWEELMAVVSRPEFVTNAFGYAAYTAVVAGLGNFGPTFLLGLQLVKSQSQASLTFGGVIAVTGVFGTLTGGLLLDRLVTREDKKRRKELGLPPPHDEDSDSEVDRLEEEEEEEEERRLASGELEEGKRDGMGEEGYGGGGLGEVEVTAAAAAEEDASTALRMVDIKLSQATWLTTLSTCIAFVLVLGAPFLSSTLGLFLATLGVGSLFLFASTAAVSVATMSSVPAKHRPFAIGLATVVTHAFGDVPSPAIIGLLADDLSPIPPPHSHKVRSAAGLRATMALTCLWLLWAILLWGLTFLYAKRRENAHKRHRQYKELGGSDVLLPPYWNFCARIERPDLDMMTGDGGMDEEDDPSRALLHDME